MNDDEYFSKNNVLRLFWFLLMLNGNERCYVFFNARGSKYVAKNNIKEMEL